MNQIINLNFWGTFGKVGDKQGEAVTIRDKVYSNIRKSEDTKNLKTKYTFSGSDLLDIGSTNVAHNVKNAIDIVKEDIKSSSQDNQLKIIVEGHSRGAIAATRVVDILRDIYKEKNNVKISLRISDPYAGPTGTGKDVAMDLGKESETKNEDIIFYSMGTKYKCSPQKILHAKTVVICKTGHDNTLRFKNEKTKDDNIDQLEAGVYLLEEINATPLKITKNNLKYVMDCIYNFDKSYSGRTKVLTEVILKKLNIKIDDVLETGAVREWKPALDKAIHKIKTSWFLTRACSDALSLFDDNLFGPYVDKKGEFFKHLEKARNCVCGMGKNDFKTAILELDAVIKNSKNKYKRDIATALKDRIEIQYKHKHSS